MSPGQSKSGILRGCLKRSPVVPVLTITGLEDAVPLARALVEGGLSVLEVTLRSSVALEAISAIRKAMPDAVIAAGTVLSPADLRCATEAGAQFAVSPGATPRLLEAARTAALPLLPGAATASEAMLLLELGFDTLKFFPAESAGGVSALKAMAGPLPQIIWCPTGGIDAAKAAAYLALPSVLCVGGSWIVPTEALAQKNWQRIRDLARSAAAVGSAQTT